MGHLHHEPCAGLTRASMVRFHCWKVHGLPDPGNDELRRNLTIPPRQKTMESSFGGIDVDFRF
jgi:hypothetical protein